MKKTLFLLTFLFAMVTVVMNTNDVYAYSETSNEEDIMPMYVTIQNTSTSLTIIRHFITNFFIPSHAN